MSLLFALLPFSAMAQELTMSALFQAMPDSLMPYLTRNNRLDMIDFMEAHMKAEVTNLFDAKSEMTFLSPDSLSIKMNGVLRVEMKLVKTGETADSSHVTVAVKRTYMLNENQTESIVDVYTSAWCRLSSRPGPSSVLRRDDEIFARPHF